jgi:hypothetical protein
MTIFAGSTFLRPQGTYVVRKAALASVGRYLLTALGLVALLVGIVAAVYVGGQGSGPGPDLARSKKSLAGLFLVSIRPESGVVRLGGLEPWLLTVKTPAGKPVENAAIDISGGMPLNNHVLPTSPQATAYLGGGHYRIEGVKFDASGWWQLRFTISASVGSDTAVFNLVL